MRRALLPVLGALLACAPPVQPPTSPSDDPGDWAVDDTVAWVPALGEVRQVVPSRALPPETRPVLPSNNNADVVHHGGRLYLAWRTSETHFASEHTRLQVVSSEDLGVAWRHETTVFQQTDKREPLFLSLGGRLWLHWFEAGTDRFSFEPKRQWRIERREDGTWSEPEQWGLEKEITWALEVRGGVAYRTSYTGTHYMLGMRSDLQLRFSRSLDGLTWEPLSGDGIVYRGGVSEAAFEFEAPGGDDVGGQFDQDGRLWAVTRNEDGDATGFGSHVCSAEADALGTWTCSAKSDPERYDSPKMFRHGRDLFLVARRDVGGPFDQGRDELSFADKQLQYLAAYSGRPKRTALYRVDTVERKVKWVFDFPSAGDTAFPSIQRLDAHRFLISNYTSPLSGDLDRSWWNGQNAPEGTHVVFMELRFEPAP